MNFKNNKVKIAACALTASLILTGCAGSIKELISGAKAEFNSGSWIVIEQEEPGIIIADSTRPTTAPETFVPPTTEEIIIPETTIPPEETEETKKPEETEEPEETFVPEETKEPEDTKEPEPTEKPPVPIEPPVKPEFQETKVVYAKEEATIYANKSENALPISSLNVNEAAYRIASYENGWCLVKQNNFIGYVQGDKLEYSKDYFESEYIHLVHNDIVVTTSTLNFRTGPSEEYDVLYTFAKNTELQVIAEANNGWLVVRHNGTIGYVHSGYTQSMLARAQDLYPELDLNEINPQMVVYTTSGLNIRCGNSTEFESLGLLEKYETLRVLGEYDDWYFVMTNDYNFGFVNKNYTQVLKDRYVIVDKSEQRLYLYNNNDLLYVTPVTTGKDATPSDTGLFKILNKNRNVTLTDNETYWSPVDYWMRYNGGEGLHDASWRSVFGTESYHYAGSHGCINIPPAITDEIYENVEVGTKVLVHK